jgi:Tol biopolymer transport system component
MIKNKEIRMKTFLYLVGLLSIFVLVSCVPEQAPEIETAFTSTPLPTPILTSTPLATPAVTMTETSPPIPVTLIIPTASPILPTPTTLPPAEVAVSQVSNLIYMVAAQSDMNGFSIDGRGAIYLISLNESNPPPDPVQVASDVNWGRLYLASDGTIGTIVIAGPAFGSPGYDIRVYDSVSGQLRHVFNGLSPEGRVYDWHPDRHQIVMSAESNYPDVGLWLVDSNTGEHLGLRTRTPEIGSLLGGFGGAAISPDGQRVVYSRLTTSDEEGLWIVNADGSNSQRLQAPHGDANAFDWSPDGQLIAFQTSEGIHVMDGDGANIRLVSMNGTPFPFALNWSPDSRTLAFVTYKQIEPSPIDGVPPERSNETIVTAEWPEPFLRAQIHLLDVMTGEERPLLPDNSIGYLDPAWSPDGSQIAFVSMQSGFSELWVVNMDGTDLRQLTTMEQYVRYPAWVTTSNP